MSFSNKQLQVLQFAHSDKDAVICDGSIRSGKSSVLSIAFILWAMSNFDNKNFSISSKTVSVANRNIIKPLLNVRYLQEHFNMKHTVSNNLLTVTRGRRTNYFYIFGGRDEASYTTIQGITTAGAFLDEVALMPQSFVNQALARCSETGSKFWFSCNPEGPTHWFYQEWILNYIDKNAEYIHFTLEDNPSLTDSIKERYHRMYAGVFYERYIMGRWVKAEGIIYRKFADNPEDYILDEVPEDIIFVNAGVDFGGTKSSTTFVLTGFTRMLEKVVVLEAKRITDELDPSQLDALFEAWCREMYAKYEKPFVARCDNAEPVLIRGLKNVALRKNLPVRVANALKKPIKERIDLVQKLIGLGRFFVMRQANTVTQALSNAVWDQNHPDERLDDGVTSDIDTMDAMEYSIEEHLNKLIDKI